MLSQRIVRWSRTRKGLRAGPGCINITAMGSADLGGLSSGGMKSMSRILIVEDEFVVSCDLEESLVQLGHEVLTPVSTGPDALRAVEEHKPDLVLMDIGLKGEMDGIDTARLVRERFHIPIVYLTAYSETDVLERAKVTQPFGYLIKPFRYSDLKAVIEIGLHKSQMEKQLRLSESRYRAVVEDQTELICRFSQDGALAFVNDAFCRFLNNNSDELLGRNFYSIAAGADRDRLAHQLGSLSSHSPTVTWEHELTGPSGDIRWVQWINRVIVPPYGQEREFQAVGRDVTDRKRLEEELQKSVATAERLRLEAEAANQAKTQFLNYVSHELRTPLNAIIGFSEILEQQLQGKLTSEHMNFLRCISRSGWHLLRLVNDLLDLARVEAGKTELELSQVIIGDVVDKCLMMLKESALKRNVTVTVDVAPELSGRHIYADELKLRQILLNLLSNAVKFNPIGGRVEVTVRADGQALFVCIRDTGIGLSSQDSERIFDPFERVRHEPGQGREGTGLGLALAKMFVKLHGGKIWAESEGPGRGSSFIFTIPLVGSDC